MENIWFQSALWMALAFLAAIGSLFITISAALFEIVVGAIAGNTVGLPLTPWIDYIASFGAIVLTFLAGTDIDPHVVKRNFGSSVTIGLMGFFAPYLGCLLLARYGLGWPWPEAQIAGIALSTTSVAVVYAVMVETGYNRTELGKIILAACFINDIGTRTRTRPRLRQLQSLLAAIRSRDNRGNGSNSLDCALAVRADRREVERA
jgi:Kef-type K+ transport system membrane component KefB